MDEVIQVESYPDRDSKMSIDSWRRSVGGLTAMALVTAARQGATCRLVSVLGVDELSRYLETALATEGIDLTLISRQQEAGPVHSAVVVGSDNSRTLLFDRRAVTPPETPLPNDAVLGARVLVIDHTAGPTGVAAARTARSAGIPVVADFEEAHFADFDQLLKLTDHLVLGERFAAELTGRATPQESAAALWREDMGAVVITAGEQGAWFASAGSDEVRHCPAFSVTAVDTTGCGDVFHGAYAACLASGSAVAEAVEVAAAAAALKATGSGLDAIPRGHEVERFIRERSS